MRNTTVWIIAVVVSISVFHTGVHAQYRYIRREALFMKQPTDPYRNYGLERYRGFGGGGTIGDSRTHYDFLGNRLGSGTRVFSMSETRPGIEGGASSSISKDDKYVESLNSLVIARETYRGWSTALTIGDAIKTQFTPLTLSLSRFNGVQWDMYSSKNKFTVLLRRGETSLNHPFPLQNMNRNPGPASQSLISDDDADFLRRENNPVQTVGIHWRSNLGDVMRLGATFINQRQQNSLLGRSDNPMSGTLPYIMRAPVRLFAIVTDDSPADGIGPVSYGMKLSITGDDGVSSSWDPVAVYPVSRHEIERWQNLSFDDSKLGSAIVVGYQLEAKAFVAKLKLIEALSPNLRTQLGLDLLPLLDQGRPLAIDSDEALIYVFSLPSTITPISTEITAEVANDYRLWTSQAHPAINPAQSSVEMVYAAPTVVVRAKGNVSDFSNRRQVRFQHAHQTGQSVVGLNAELTLAGLVVEAEWANSFLFRQFPVTGGSTEETHSRAWFVNATKSLGNIDFGLELFSMSPNYQNGYNSHRGGVTLYNDYLTGHTSTIEPSEGAPPRPFEQVLKPSFDEYRLVDDNDDNDQYPDDLVFDWPGKSDQDSGVFPGNDEDHDGIPDDDRNANGLPDFTEPFLLYESDPLDFVYGADFNNNRIVDSRENDNLPDYPYNIDEKGRHGFATWRPIEGGSLTVGGYRIEQMAGGGVSQAYYINTAYALRHPRYGQVMLRHDSKRVRDTIRDDIFLFDPELAISGGFDDPRDGIKAGDPGYDRLLMRNSATWIHKTGYSMRIGHLLVLPRLKWIYTVGRQADDIARRNDFDRVLAPIIRIDYDLTSRTTFRVGFQGFGGGSNPLAARFADKIDPSRSRKTSDILAMASNRTDYYGYQVVTNLGVQSSRTDFIEDVRMDRQIWRGFLRLVVGF